MEPYRDEQQACDLKAGGDAMSATRAGGFLGVMSGTALGVQGSCVLLSVQ
jgi:hypothetical protein